MTQANLLDSAMFRRPLLRLDLIRTFKKNTKEGETEPSTSVQGYWKCSSNSRLETCQYTYADVLKTAVLRVGVLETAQRETVHCISRAMKQNCI